MRAFRGKQTHRSPQKRTRKRKKNKRGERFFWEGGHGGRRVGVKKHRISKRWGPVPLDPGSDVQE